MRLFFGSLLFSIGMIVSIILWGSVLLCGAWLPYRYRVAIACHWVRALLSWLRITCNIRYELHNAERLHNQTNAIVLVKHQSTFETFLLLLLIPNVSLVLKRELLWVPFFGWALAALNPIALDRGSPSAAMKQLIREGKKRLQRGENILMFPEGTRVPVGTQVEYKKGAFVLAAATRGIPIIPVAHNAGMFWRRKGFIKYPGIIHISIGEPIPTVQESADSLQAKTAEWIENECRKIQEMSAS